MNELFVRLFLIELSKSGGMKAVYEKEPERIVVSPKHAGFFTPLHIVYEDGECLIRYAVKERPIMQKVKRIMDKLPTQMTWWRDYLQMCFRLEYDMADRRILFPYNLRMAHQYIMKMSNVKPDPKWDKKIAGCYDRLYNAYHYEKDGYLIRPPKNYTEFAEEGNRLLHCVCVNRYYVNHVKGTNLIFFVRKAGEPEKPLYTLEYIPNQGKVQEFRGYDNCQPDSEARAFIHDWKDFLRHGERDAKLEIAA